MFSLCSVRTAALDQLTLQSSTCRQSALLEESSELLKQHHNFKTRVLSAEKQSSVSRDVEACQTLSKSTQSPVGHHRQTPDSPLGENLVRSAQVRKHHPDSAAQFLNQKPLCVYLKQNRFFCIV